MSDKPPEVTTDEMIAWLDDRIAFKNDWHATVANAIRDRLQEPPAVKAVERMAPVQGYIAGIPWAMHLRAYDAYCKKFNPQRALIEGWCRGGFGVGELDKFIPGWREELSEIAALKKEIAELRATPPASGSDKALREALQYAVDHYGSPGGPWNVPSDPGGWLDRARQALAASPPEVT